MRLGKALGIALIMFLLAGLGGCAGVGPRTITRDRFDYTKAISDSWKTQLLLNTVMLRYGDAPVFLDVTSIINSYSVETEMEGLLSFGSSVSNGQEVRGLAKYTDRPTITYHPLSGQKFARSMMTPVSITGIMHFIKSGQTVDLVFRLCLHSINGVYNRDSGPMRNSPADPDFYTLIEKLERIDEAGAVGYKIEKEGDQATPVLFFRKSNDEKIMKDISEVYKILGLDEGTREFPMVASSFPENRKELAISSRSLLEIINDLASYIEVPQKHVDERRVNATFHDKKPDDTDILPLIGIFSSREKPSDAFVAAHYGDSWFWIDNRDMKSKTIFSLIMFMFTLTETEGASGAPVITVPAS